MDVDAGGNYGARGDIQAPACAAFLFRPSSTSHWLEACRKSLGTPIHRACAQRGLLDLQQTTSKNTVDKVDSKRPNRNWIDRAPSTQRTAQSTRPGRLPSLGLFSLADRQPLTRCTYNTPAREHEVHLECANPTDHHWWHHLLTGPCCSTRPTRSRVCILT